MTSLPILSTSPAAVTAPPADNARNMAVVIWLSCTAALVFAMIVVGGATRLTESGLSITEWQPLLGAIPPLNEGDWARAFEQYQQIPQYSIVNKGMSLEAFKAIYWWEWSHRFLGRVIGIVFALPLLVFWWTGRLRRGVPLKLAGVLALGGLQGAIGWYMVKSGLGDRVDVSQYRLALHLTTAFAIFGLLVWLALEENSRSLRTTRSAATGSIKVTAAVLVGLVLLQVILGAFVAGLKAGLVYNTWPSMNGMFVPSDYWATTPSYLSVFESHAAVQFNHRMTAYLVGAAALFQLWQVWRVRADPRLAASARALALAVFAQMMLGIATLLSHVPLSLGLLHQGGGALVLATAVWHLFAAWPATQKPNSFGNV